MRLKGADGKYPEKLDELMKYELVCIGYKGGQAFYYSLGDIQPKEYPLITLRQIGENELNEQLNRMGNKTQVSGMQRENNYFQFEIRDQKREKRDQTLLELMQHVGMLIFPCMQAV